MKTTHILLVDDHTLVRAGIRALLESFSDTEVVAEANNGHEALELIKIHHPDLVLMDISMPGMNGLEATARITKEFPHVRVIILSMHLNEEFIWRALRAGACGYLVKDACTNELEIAIRAVTKGEVYLSPAVSKQVVEGYVRRVDPGSSMLEQLTPRQREILQLIVENHTTKEIAQKLNISIKTVETHRTELMNRLNIHNVAGLVRYALQNGIIPSEE